MSEPKSDYGQAEIIEINSLQKANTYDILMRVVEANIKKTMDIGEDHHGPGQWMKQHRDFHINRALKHLADFLLNDDREDLEHALCRLGMAVYQDYRQD